MTRNAKIALASVAVPLLSLSIVAGVALLVKPTLLSGGYYEITVTSVKVEPVGEVLLSFDDRLAHGVVASWKCDSLSTKEIKLWEERSPGFLLWPRSQSDGELGFCVGTQEEHQKGFEHAETMRLRVLLRAGTYRVRPGERLVFHRTTLPDGKIAEESWIQVDVRQ